MRRKSDINFFFISFVYLRSYQGKQRKLRKKLQITRAPCNNISFVKMLLKSGGKSNTESTLREFSLNLNNLCALLLPT